MLELVQEILLDDANKEMLLLANKARNKLEGWLKFELTKKLLAYDGINDVSVEKRYNLVGEENNKYSDIFFRYGGEKYLVELKTANTSYKVEGCNDRIRPLTDNINSIISDINQLYYADIDDEEENVPLGLSVFICFPLQEGGHDNLSDNSNSIFINRIVKNCEEINIETPLLRLLSPFGENVNISMLIGIVLIGNVNRLLNV